MAADDGGSLSQLTKKLKKYGQLLLKGIEFKGEFFRNRSNLAFYLPRNGEIIFILRLFCCNLHLDATHYGVISAY